MQSTNSIKRRLAFYLFIALYLPSEFAVSAIETNAALSAGVEHSDNVNRQDDVAATAETIDDTFAGEGPRSDIESRIQLDVGLLGNTAQFDTELAYTLTARDFKNDNQTDDEVIEGDARILWTPLPDRFAWELTNNVSDTVRDDRLADIPNNREQRNILATGPNFIFRISPVDRLSAELRYVDVNVDTSSDIDDTTSASGLGSDSERKTGRLRWVHNLSSISDFLVNVEYEDVEASLDLTYTRLLVGYGARLRSGSYQILIGGNKVKPDVGDDFDGSVVQLGFSHDFGGHGLDITMIKEATDTSVGFGTSSLRSETFDPRDSNFDTFAIVERQRADISYQNFLVCGGCSISASVLFDDQDYQDVPGDQGLPARAAGDQKSYGFTLGFAYALRGNLGLFADARYDVTEFVDDPEGLEYELTEYILGINYDFVRDFSINFRVIQSTRDANVQGSDFDELRGGIGLRYTF